MGSTTDVILQTNIVANTARSLIFFEGDEVCYNYKTGQWSAVPAYDGYGMFSVNDKAMDIGLVVYSSGSVDLQEQLTSMKAQEATVTTAAVDINEGGRVVVSGVRPIMNGGTPTVRVGMQNHPDDAVTWSTATSLNSRTNFANMRSEGRYVRAEVTVADDFTTLTGADVEFRPQGKV